MTAVLVWFEGGPVDGRLIPVETDPHEHLPDTVLLPRTGVYVGRHDEPSPTVEHRYIRTNDTDGQIVYRYHGGVERQQAASR